MLECVTWKEGIIISRNFFSIFIDHMEAIHKWTDLLVHKNMYYWQKYY